MSADQSMAAVPLTAPGSMPASRRRLEGSQGVDPARPLGATALALQIRRRVQAVRDSAGYADATDTPQRWTLSTNDGALTFVLISSESGLCIERTLRRPIDTHLCQYMVFADAASFLRWCDSDPVRFTHPLLYARLLRHGHEHFEASR